MTRRLPLLAVLLGIAAPLSAQGPDSTRQTATDSLLHQGATVRVRIPSLGPDLIVGTVGRSNTSPGCLGLGLEKRDNAGRQYFSYLKAVTQLEVDRRTNTGVRSRLDTPAAPEDWQLLTKAQLAVADSGCHRR